MLFAVRIMYFLQDAAVVRLGVACLVYVIPYLGAFSSEVPPLPIPNREVKLTNADGTAMQCGRVGRRRLNQSGDFRIHFLRSLFLLYEIK